MRNHLKTESKPALLHFSVSAVEIPPRENSNCRVSTFETLPLSLLLKQPPSQTLMLPQIPEVIWPAPIHGQTGTGEGPTKDTDAQARYAVGTTPGTYSQNIPRCTFCCTVLKESIVRSRIPQRRPRERCETRSRRSCCHLLWAYTCTYLRTNTSVLRL